MKERINLSIEKSLYDKFRKYCQERGMKMSSKIELFIKKEMKLK